MIGVGVDWTGASGRAFFTKNGELIGYAFEQMQGILWPSIGLRTPGEEIRANFGGSEFMYDIDAYVRVSWSDFIEVAADCLI